VCSQLLVQARGNIYVLGVELSGPFLSEPSKTSNMFSPKHVGNGKYTISSEEHFDSKDFI
jgi:hypothetical protein